MKDKKDDKKKADPSNRRSHRYTAASDFKVNGVEHGIVLAASFARGARPGVYWPARVMHASEATNSPGIKNKRNAPRQRLDLVFLLPIGIHGRVQHLSPGSWAAENRWSLIRKV